MKPLYVSFYTPEYQKYVDALWGDINKHGIRAYTEWRPSFPSWHDAVTARPEFILQMAKRHHPRPIVWIDIDARIHSPPTLLDTLAENGTNLAFHCFFKNPPRPFHLLTGTLLVYDCMDFLEDWVKETTGEKDTQIPELKSFQRAFERASLKWHNLPPEYCWKQGDFEALHPGKKPVIEHLMASRQMNPEHKRG